MAREGARTVAEPAVYGCGCGATGAAQAAVRVFDGSGGGGAGGMGPDATTVGLASETEPNDEPE
jgi:hypothetical protein